jgi:hypothetical protein
MAAQSPPRGCGLLSFGYTCLVVGCLFGLIGTLWHIPHLTRADAVIVQSVPMSSWSNARLITYEYTAYGVRHRGQRLFRWSRSIPAGFYKAGEPFPVYFVTDKPDLSYGPYPPSSTTFAGFAIMFAALGITFIVSAALDGSHPCRLQGKQARRLSSDSY